MSSETPLVCPSCGASLDASDHQDEPVLVGQQRCARCECGRADPAATAARHLNLAAILIAVGLFALALSLLADVFRFGDRPGFGWQQGAGLGLATILLLTGAVLRIPVLYVIGVAFGLLTLLADWLAFGSAEGFGRNQVLGCILGALMLVASAAVARAFRPREVRTGGDPNRRNARGPDFVPRSRRAQDGGSRLGRDTRRAK